MLTKIIVIEVTLLSYILSFKSPLPKKKKKVSKLIGIEYYPYLKWV